MALYLIQKYKLDKSGKRSEPYVHSRLTERERTLLIDFFILDGLLTPAEKKELLHLCKTIHERDIWLQCDCLQGGIQPVFRFNRASSGSLYLHHITSRAEHAPQSVFKERIWSAQVNKTPKTTQYIKKSTPLNLVPKKSMDISALKKEDKPQRNTASSGTRCSPCKNFSAINQKKGLDALPQKFVRLYHDLMEPIRTSISFVPCRACSRVLNKNDSDESLHVGNGEYLCVACFSY